MAKSKSKKKAPRKGSSKKFTTKKMVARTPVQPAGDRVLVRRSQPEEMTKFGIIIPDTNKEKSEEGVIVAVGPGRKTPEGKLIPVSFEAGQRVRFSYGDELKINGVEHVLVHEDSIVAIINN